MNWSSMNKEQKQLAVLGGIIGITLVLAVYQFVLAPRISAAGDTAGDLSALQDKLMEADRLLPLGKGLDQQHETLAATLNTLAREDLPGHENPLSWATRKLYQAGRETGLNIDSVEELNSTIRLWNGSEHKLTFFPFTVKLSARSGYDKVVALINRMEERHPYATVTGFGIMADGSNPQNHRFELVIEWPISQDPAWAENLPGHRVDSEGRESAKTKESQS